MFILPLLVAFLPLQDNDVSPTAAEIVVTGERVEKAQKALDQCRAKNCPLRDDILLSLTLADAQFLEGDYRNSRRTLMAAKRRNARFASHYPLEVAALHRATGRLHSLNGKPERALGRGADAVDALRTRYDPVSREVLLQRLSNGDGLVRTHEIEAGLARYADVARAAERAGLLDIQGLAMLRRAMLLTSMAESIWSYRALAERARAAILDNRDPRFLPFRNAVRIMPVREAKGEEVRKAVIDAVMAQLEPDPSPRPNPLLVYQPSLRIEDFHFGLASGTSDPAFVDISFRILPSGETADIHLINLIGPVAPLWTDIVMKAIAQRRYAPMANADGQLRLERTSFVSDVIGGTSPGGGGGINALGSNSDSMMRAADSAPSRMPHRSAQRRLEIMDLTPKLKPDADPEIPPAASMN
ncbi:hypothetical protein [Sphingomonas yabuuchiae]|nr:hypothetical protein [Sphingomonas yabuuchiae]MBN3560464.1 hypothetical protein [Sphingomonas yabuuchiae]